MKEVVINLYLLWGAGQDIRERKISNIYLIVGMIIGLGFALFNILIGGYILGKWVAAYIPGIIFLILAKVLKEKVGMGDGLLLLVLGNFYNFQEIWMLLQVMFFLLTFVSIILIFGKKGSKNYQIPLLPFLWMSHTLLWGLHYV